MKKLTKKQKQKMRIAVAKDVIIRIQMRKLTGKTGEYIIRKGTSLKKYSTPNQAEKGCNVCALGAAFLSYVRLYNGANKPLNHYYGSDMCELMYSCFTDDQLLTIDDYFEDHWGTNDDTNRILMIMQNVVDGKGKFNPSIEYEIVEV